jgi:Cdc6-like AAA superfamily ATPase
MTLKEKQNIQARLQEYVEQKGSQNKAARSLNDVSAGTLSQILAGNWELISDDMWRNIAHQVGYVRRAWNIVPTRGYAKMTQILTDAQDNALVLAVVGDAACGKTEAIRHYVAANRNVYHICCGDYWNRKHFLTELLRSMGVEASGTITDMMFDAVQTLKKKDAPMVILDEADKLSDQVLYFFITLYNQLEDHCSILVCATDYLEKKILRGVKNNRKGYREIYSRLGRKFIGLPIPNRRDVAAVCRANGVEDGGDIAKIAEEADGDMRRVKRLVWSIKTQQEEA